MKKLLCLFLTLFICLSVNSVQASLIQDQTSLDAPIVYGAVTSNFSWIQGVTTGIDGLLANVEVFLTDFDGEPNPQIVTADIYVGGVSKGTDSLLYNDVGSSSLLFDYSTDNIFLESGDLFELWLIGTESLGSYAFDINSNGYTGGILSSTLGSGEPFPEYDLRFITNVAPVPEPSTFLLLGGGLAGLAFYARRRRKE